MDSGVDDIISALQNINCNNNDCVIDYTKYNPNFKVTGVETHTYIWNRKYKGPCKYHTEITQEPLAFTKNDKFLTKKYNTGFVFDGDNNKKDDILLIYKYKYGKKHIEIHSDKYLKYILDDIYVFREFKDGKLIYVMLPSNFFANIYDDLLTSTDLLILSPPKCTCIKS